MSAIEDKAVSIMDAAMAGADKLTEKLAELATQYGPDVVNAGLQVARFTAAQSLLYGFIYAVCAVMCFRICRWGFRKAIEDDWDNPAYMMAMVASFAVGVATTVSAIVKLADIWAWIGVIEPKLWIAHRILEKAL